MPAPKDQGKLLVAQGIKYNRKFHFWIVYQCFNTPNTTDKNAFFVTEQEARDHFNSLNQ